MTNKTQAIIPQNWDTTRQWLPVETVAAIRGSSVPTAWRHAKIGILPAPKKIGASTRWDSLELAESLRNAGTITEHDIARAKRIGSGRGKAA